MNASSGLVPMQILVMGPELKIFPKSEFHQKCSTECQDGFHECACIFCKSFLHGNLVDGLPSARHTMAVGGPHGVIGSTTICKLEPLEIENGQKMDWKLESKFR